MTPATRVRLTVGAAAVAAAGTVTGVVLATRQSPAQPSAKCDSPPTPLVVPGVASKEVGAVRAALRKPAKQAALALVPVGQRAPKDPVVQFNLGLALFCAGYLSEAERAFLAAKSSGRDTYYEMRADQILHPQFFAPPDGLYPVFELVGRNPLIAKGVLLQRQGHQHSAARAYDAAVRADPSDDQAAVAAAVARFDESNLSASFSRLGPLTRRFPRSQSVRYHLGLLLAWTGQRDEAVKQFTAARRLGPQTPLGKHASTFLQGLVPSGTKRSGR